MAVQGKKMSKDLKYLANKFIQTVGVRNIPSMEGEYFKFLVYIYSTSVKGKVSQIKTEPI